MWEIIISQMPVELLLYSDGEDININNVNRESTPDDVYYQTCQKYQTQTWITLHPQYPHLARLKLLTSDIQALMELGQVRCSSGRQFRISNLEGFSTRLIAFVTDSIRKFPRAFLRLSHKSYKNSFSTKLRPLTTVIDVFDALTSSYHLLRTLNMPEQELFIMKWVDIDKQREYRVFIIDAKLVGISQQECYKTFSVTSERKQQALADATLIIDYYTRHQATFNSFGYQTVTLDVFIHEETVNLIECNPPSYWCSSGSSLFTAEDFTRFNTGETTYVKIR